MPFKDDNASQWKSGKFDSRSLRNPWINRHLNLHGRLRREPYPYAKFYHDTIDPHPLPPNMQKCASSDSANFLVLPSAYSQDPCVDFHDQYVKKWRGFAQGCAFWGPENKIILYCIAAHRHNVTCCEVISSFVIFAVLDLRVGGCRP